MKHKLISLSKLSNINGQIRISTGITFSILFLSACVSPVQPTQPPPVQVPVSTSTSSTQSGTISQATPQQPDNIATIAHTIENIVATNAFWGD